MESCRAASHDLMLFWKVVGLFHPSSNIVVGTTIGGRAESLSSNADYNVKRGSAFADPL